MTRLLRSQGGYPRPGAVAAAVALLAASACYRPAPPPAGAKQVSSNILRADYAGSQSCRECHRAEYDRFMQGPMHNMTRLPQAAAVHAPFDGSAFVFKRDSVILDSAEGARRMRIRSPEFGNHDFRVTRVIGGHHREDFAGVEFGQSDTLTERILPVSWSISAGRFRYKGYSVMTPERPGLKPGAVWNKTCMFCHNTVPYFSVTLGALTGRNEAAYQGVLVDRLLPADRAWSYRITDSAAFREALDQEIAFLKGSPPSVASTRALAHQAIAVTREHFRADKLLEVGIGCETCHGGCKEHVENPSVRPSLEPRSPFLAVGGAWEKARGPSSGSIAPATGSADAFSPANIDAREAEVHACAHCHQVLFSSYPWTWEGASRNGPHPGGAHINSGEARDLLLSNCKVGCTACHDPHAHDDRERIERLEGPQGNSICLQCHGNLSSPEALRAHAHHDPAGPGGLCLNCHMPRKEMSLDTRLARYHRIGSPNDPVKVERDRPLECALCHGDKAVAQLVAAMESWWPHRYDRDSLKALYGDTNSDALAATLKRGKPHEKAVALYLAQQQRRKDLAPWIAAELSDPYPLVRYYADNALSALLEKPSPLSLHGDTDSLMRAAAAWLKASGLSAPATRNAGESAQYGEEED